MALFEDIIPGCKITGVIDNDVVTVVAVQRRGDEVLDITYRDSKGNTGTELIFRSDQDDYEIVGGSKWTYTADADLFRLVSESYRIELAHLFDPYLAVRTSEIEPLPHQITAVYQEMLPRLPLRYVLADDPGAGKTIMTGLLAKELIIRGDLKRCLIVCPGNLAENWQDELFSKFDLRFDILTNDRIESAVTGNVFNETDLCIARLDKLSRDEGVQEKLKASTWDLIVVDEAHKMSASVFGNDVKKTKRYQLGEMLRTITRNFLLLTATPHNGKPEDFQLFMSLLDPDRFEGAKRNGEEHVDVSNLMRRLTKEELLKFDGRPLFPERIAYTVNYELSGPEEALYDAVTEYVTEEFNRADKLDGDARNSVGFALTILQRRLASSPEAIYQSLRRRRERLENRVQDEKTGRARTGYTESFGIGEDFDEDDFSEEERDAFEEDVADKASAARTIAELEAEIGTLKLLERMANDVRISGLDKKWDELSYLLQDRNSVFSSDGQREKLIIFTEHKDTLRYLASKIRSLLGNEEAVVTIQGGMSRDDRHHAEERFKQDPEVRILVATDAAGEGINLQRAHLMINYDLPWNPNRLEQRFGRIHRIGQTEVCTLWNLVSANTREGMVFEKLFAKLEEERSALGGKVFDVLGSVEFGNQSLRDLLIEAIRYGNDPEVRKRLETVVDGALDREAIQRLIDENALTDDMMDARSVTEVKEEMERAEAHKLEPHFIEAFFLEAFQRLGGAVRKREEGRYSITTVPYPIRGRNAQAGYGKQILQRYDRICFDKRYCNVPGQVPAELVCPGHPLLEAVSSLIREHNAPLLRQGTVFVDESDFGTDPRLLFYLEDAIQDATVTVAGTRRIISKEMHFVEMKEDGTAASAGYAPYLDYRAPSMPEAVALTDYINGQGWLNGDVESRAIDYAVSHIVGGHLEAVRSRRTQMLDRTRHAVRERLTKEIQYWDNQAYELSEKEKAGKKTRLSSQNAQRYANELEARMKTRLDELERARKMKALSPVVVAGAVVIPKGLLDRIMGIPISNPASAIDRKRIEDAGMKAVMDIERDLGYVPRDVSADNCGYDIESIVPGELTGDEPRLRCIEVKGRTADAATVTVSKNEILTALNKSGSFYLAVVLVDGDKTKTTYLKPEFGPAPGFAEISKTFDIAKLMEASELILER